MELTWYGRTCVRLRGRDAVVVADPYPAIVGPTGRGITGEIVTYSHPDDRPLPKAKGRRSRDGSTVLPSSLDNAFVGDGPCVRRGCPPPLPPPRHTPSARGGRGESGPRASGGPGVRPPGEEGRG